MNKPVTPEFFKAFDHIKAEMNAKAKALNLLPPVNSYTAFFMDSKNSGNTLPPVSSYTNEGESIYHLEVLVRTAPRNLYQSESMCRLKDIIAKLLGMGFKEAEQHLLRMMDNRNAVGLSNEGVLVNSNIHINCVQ